MAKEYNIKNNEILIAIPKGYSGELCVKLAKPILKNSRLLRLVSPSMVPDSFTDEHCIHSPPHNLYLISPSSYPHISIR